MADNRKIPQLTISGDILVRIAREMLGRLSFTHAMLIVCTDFAPENTIQEDYHYQMVVNMFMSAKEFESEDIKKYHSNARYPVDAEICYVGMVECLDNRYQDFQNKLECLLVEVIRLRDKGYFFAQVLEKVVPRKTSSLWRRLVEELVGGKLEYEICEGGNEPMRRVYPEYNH